MPMVSHKPVTLRTTGTSSQQENILVYTLLNKSRLLEKNVFVHTPSLGRWSMSKWVTGNKHTSDMKT